MLIGCLAPNLAAGQAALLGAADVERVTLEDAVRRAHESNLELRVARNAVAAADARVISAGALPNPFVTATREQLAGASDSYDETAVTLSQALEVGGQRGARLAASRGALEAARARYDAERLRITFAVERAFLRAAMAEANLESLSEATETVRRVEESGRVRFAEGDISRFAHSRLQVERARYETLLASESLALADAARELTVLVAPEALGDGISFLPATRLPELGAPAAAVALEAALAAAGSRADVVAAEAQIDALGARLSLARRERIPTPTLTAGFKHQADGFQGAVIGLSLPLPLWDRNSGAIAEAEGELAAAVARRDLVLVRAQADIRAAWDRFQSLEQRVTAVGETLLPESAGLLQTARVAYTEGEMSLIELLDAADAYRSARETVNRLLGDYLIALYDLERATGHLAADLPAFAVPASR